MFLNLFNTGSVLATLTNIEFKLYYLNNTFVTHRLLRPFIYISRLPHFHFQKEPLSVLQIFCIWVVAFNAIIPRLLILRKEKVTVSLGYTPFNCFKCLTAINKLFLPEVTVPIFLLFDFPEFILNAFLLNRLCRAFRVSPVKLLFYI